MVRNNRPATEIVTARYRLVNPYTARVFGVTPAFKNANDLSEFAEVQIPKLHEYAPGQSEYAGVLTTTSFLYRYPNTESNRNRKRARYFFQHFLGFDIMQSVPRLDLSTIDFAADPWRKNPVCTGCHATLDPVAGAFQNWTNCFSGQGIRYYRPGERYCQGAWYPDGTMFPPGTGQGAAQIVSNYSDYRVIDGFPVAFHLDVTTNGEKDQTLVLEECKINPGVDPKLFEKPAPPTAAPSPVAAPSP